MRNPDHGCCGDPRRPRPRTRCHHEPRREKAFSRTRATGRCFPRSRATLVNEQIRRRKKKSRQAPLPYRSRAAARAWFAPFPPQHVSGSASATTVSPGCGRAETGIVRSRLADPTTTIVPEPPPRRVKPRCRTPLGAPRAPHANKMSTKDLGHRAILKFLPRGETFPEPLLEALVPSRLLSPRIRIKGKSPDSPMKLLVLVLSLACARLRATILECYDQSVSVQYYYSVTIKDHTRAFIVRSHTRR